MENLFTRDLPEVAPPVLKPLQFLLKYLKPSMTAPFSYAKLVKTRQKDQKLTRGLLRKIIFGTLPTLARVENRQIAIPNGQIAIRIYTPHHSGPIPIMMYYHGGGFVFGHLDLYDSILHQFASSLNVIVVSVDYRLSPEKKFPVPVSDCWEATQWVLAHAVELEGTQDGVIVAGDSAGGMIAAELILKCLREGSTFVKAQILLFPWLDGKFNYPSCKEFATGYSLTLELMQYFAECYQNTPDDWLNPKCSPLMEQDLHNHCPTLIITAMYDVLRDQGFQYAERLKTAHNIVEYKNYCQCIHDMLIYHKVAPNGKALMSDFLNTAKKFLENI